METIKALSEISKTVIKTGVCINMKIGTFEVVCQKRNRLKFKKEIVITVLFDLHCTRQHIQPLRELGVIFSRNELLEKPKIPGHQPNQNDMCFHVRCSISVLEQLEKFSRDNHTHHVVMGNNQQLQTAGFGKKIGLSINCFDRSVMFSKQALDFAQRLRTRTQKKLQNKNKDQVHLLPIEQRAMSKVLNF